MSEQNAIGHNQGSAFNPEVIEGLKSKAAEFGDAAGQWKGAGPIETEEQAAKANDFLNGARLLAKDVEARRKEEKQAFLDAGREIDAAFNDVKEFVNRSGLAVTPEEIQ